MITLLPWWTHSRANPSMTIGREFFQTALKDYEDWRVKWFREAIQNSVDAGSTLIQIKTSENADGTRTVSVEDNGGGMSEDVLINKFLVLGGTTKVGVSGSAGGFGKAKELLVLPWISWRIHTGDTEVNGAGTDYTVTKVARLKGTLLEVVMPADNYTYEAPAIAFIEKCNLPGIRFTVNGEPHKANLRPGKLVESIDGKVELYFNKAKVESSRLIVRTKGLFMFDSYIGTGVPGYVIAEITAPSIEILTANRDGFRDYYVRQKVSEYVSRLAKDVLSATRGKKGLIREKFEGTGKFTSGSVDQFIEQIGPVREDSTPDDNAIKQIVEIVSDARKFDAYRREDSNGIGGISAETAETIAEVTIIHGAQSMASLVKQLVWKPDFLLVNEIEGARVPKKFYPGSMTPTVLKLAKIWTEMCRFVLIQLGSISTFGVGFIFDESTNAEYQEGNQEHWILLNPYKRAKRVLSLRPASFFDQPIWQPSKLPDLKWLYALAIHECTHLADGINYHDESFASALTHNMAICADGFRQIKKIVGAIRMQGSPEAE